MTTTETATVDSFLGRQPIFDRSMRTYGYELLYRNDHRNVAFFSDPDDATRCVLDQALLEWGFDRVVGDRFGFVNVAAGVLNSDLLQVLPKDRTVIELSPDIALDPETVLAITTEQGAGRRFALDGVAVRHLGRLAQIAPLIHVVKIDLPAAAGPAAWALVSRIRIIFPKALLLAHRVEERSHFQLARELGCDLFQGYFFAKPEVLQRSERPTNMTAAMILLAEVNRPEVDIDRIVQVFSTDPTLTYGLLKLVNAGSCTLATPVSSIRQAIVLLGTAQVRRLAILLTMATGRRGVNEELVVLAATRANVAAAVAGDDPALVDAAFTTGMLSVIDVVFQQPMAELLDDLTLVPSIYEALVHGTGPLGTVLSAVFAFERADVDELQRLVPMRMSAIHTAFGEGAAWGESMRFELTR